MKRIRPSLEIVCRRLLGALALCAVLTPATWSQDDTSASPDPAPPPQLAFTETEFDNLREGYVSLEWNAFPEADAYEVVSSSGSLVYSGALPHAFISGLENGSYSFSVRALSDSGEPIAESELPASVTVNHWSKTHVMILFTIGLVVVLMVVSVIVRGATHSTVGPSTTSSEVTE